MSTPISVKLFVTQQSDSERLTIRDSNIGTPDDQSTWLFGKLEKAYGDRAYVCACCWVTWDCWILIGTDGVKASLLDEVKKWRRRQLRGKAVSVACAPTFVLR